MTSELVYGRRPVREVLRGPREVRELWATERAIRAEHWLRDETPVRVQRKPERDLNAEAGTADHPYQLFYYIWKLSYLFGRRYADHSLAFEQLVTDPAGELEDLLGALDLRGDLAALQKLFSAPPLGKWKEYADADWFRGHETVCETTLANFFGAGAAPKQAHPYPRPNQVASAPSANRTPELQPS